MFTVYPGEVIYVGRVKLISESDGEKKRAFVDQDKRRIMEFRRLVRDVLPESSIRLAKIDYTDIDLSSLEAK